MIEKMKAEGDIYSEEWEKYKHIEDIVVTVDYNTYLYKKINELVDEVEELRILINGLLGAVAAIIKSSSPDPPK